MDLMIHVEKETETHSSVLAWRVPGTGEPGGLLSLGSHRVGHDWSCLTCMHALEKEMAIHSSALAWRIPGKEEPGRLPSMGSRRVGHDWATSLTLFPFMHWRRNGNPLQCSCLNIPGMEEPDRLQSTGLRRVGHDWSDLAAAAPITHEGSFQMKTKIQHLLMCLFSDNFGKIPLTRECFG